MKDIISYETAFALEKAGFPQPDPEPGQFWYTQKGTACICMKAVPGWITIAFPGDIDTYDTHRERLTFIPSVADLLRELHGLSLSFAMGVFFVYDNNGSRCRSNPAELLAAAWLEKSKKQ